MAQHHWVLLSLLFAVCCACVLVHAALASTKLAAIFAALHDRGKTFLLVLALLLALWQQRRILEQVVHLYNNSRSTIGDAQQEKAAAYLLNCTLLGSRRGHEAFRRLELSNLGKVLICKSLQNKM